MKRWYGAAAALVCGTVFGVSLAASCAVPGFELVDTLPSSGGAGGTGAGNPNGGSAACDNVEPPLAPTTTDPGSDVDFVVAVRTLDFGEDFDTAEGPIVGYDLDARCTCLGDEPSCGTVGNEPEDCDGPGGRDNAVARLFDNLSLFEPQSFNSQYHSAQANMGDLGLLFRVMRWNGAANDEDVTLAIYTSPGIDQNPCAPGVTMPAWDGSDVWPVDSFAVNTGGGGGAPGGAGGMGGAGGLGGAGGSGGAGGGPAGGMGGTGGAGGCGEPGFDVDDPVFVSEFGYVSEGVLVANLPEAGITLGVDNETITLRLLGGFVTARIEESGGGYFLRSAIMTGRWRLADFFGILGTIRTNDEPICKDHPLYGPVKEIVCNYADIHAGVSGSATPCDAMSFGMAFEAEPAQLGVVVAPDVGGGGPSCAPDLDPDGDDCSDQGS